MKNIILIFVFFTLGFNANAQEGDTSCAPEVPRYNYFGKGNTKTDGKPGRLGGFYEGAETRISDYEKGRLSGYKQGNLTLKLDSILSVVLGYYGISYNDGAKERLSDKLKSFNLSEDQQEGLTLFMDSIITTLLEYHGVPYENASSLEDRLAGKLKAYQIYKFNKGVALTNRGQGYDLIVGPKTREELLKDKDIVCREEIGENVAKSSSGDNLAEGWVKITPEKKDSLIRIRKDIRFFFVQFLYGFGEVLDSRRLEYTEGAIGFRIAHNLYLGGSVMYENVHSRGKEIRGGAMLVYDFRGRNTLPITFGYQISFGEIVYHSVVASAEIAGHISIVGKYNFLNPSMGIGIRLTL